MMLRFVVVFLLFVSGVSAHAADFQTGSDAYDRGDYATALEEWRPLAEQGHAEAQYHLGVMYDEGTGVSKDNVFAYMWFSVAASMGNDAAVEQRDRVAGKMTPAQLQEARQLARECVNRNYKGC